MRSNLRDGRVPKKALDQLNTTLRYLATSIPLSHSISHQIPSNTLQLQRASIADVDVPTIRTLPHLSAVNPAYRFAPLSNYRQVIKSEREGKVR